MVKNCNTCKYERCTDELLKEYECCNALSENFDLEIEYYDTCEMWEGRDYGIDAEGRKRASGVPCICLHR